MKEDFSEIEIGTTTESFQKFLESQEDLFHNQIDQLKDIVITQCKLTGINPLAQEMAAGALSINIGKRPRDLLNPKAVKYMQSVFAIKDAISKKESREISALFGVTAGQVRDFFVSQRTRVRKIVRLAKERSVSRLKDRKEPQDEVPASNYSMLPIDPIPLNVIGPTNDETVSLNTVGPVKDEAMFQNTFVSTSTEPIPLSTVVTTSTAVVSLNTIGPTGSEIVPLNTVAPASAEPVPLNAISATGAAPIPLNVAGPVSVMEAPLCSTQDDSDKRFVENIFNLMRKEESFSGQVKLMEWILRTENSSVLNWFLTQGGVMILATWLSEAASEEQTSLLSVILKVLCHLPMHKALPVHMSVILQSVNRLRFYRMSDISNRARVLLSRWSKVFARSQALRRPNGLKSSSDTQKDIMLTQSISEIMSDESWQSELESADGNLAPSYETSGNIRKQDPLKLLTASGEDPSRRNILGVSSSQTRGRRKVQLVEQPGQKSASRSPQVTKTVSASQSRPMSADDIQKAKMRAQFRRCKYGKSGSGSNGSGEVKPEVSNKLETNHSTVLPPASKVDCHSKNEEHKKPVVPPQKFNHQPGAPTHPNTSLIPKEPFWKQCQRVQIPWQAPPEIRINDDWSVGTGENSKEIEVQRNRIRRERETVYQTVQEIPVNPKNPWDIEMDYDDTLTPEIPIEQLPDMEISQTEIPPLEYENRAQSSAAASVLSQGSSNASNGSGPEPDLELLAVLLKNPDLVFALTSGQAGNLSSEEMVRLLDAIKSNGAGLLVNTNLNGISGGGGGMAVEQVEVSLPSPTPSSNPGTSGWRPEVAKNPFTKQSYPSNTDNYASRGAVAAIPGLRRASSTNLTQPAIVPSLPQQFPSAITPYSLPQRHNIFTENRAPSITPPQQQNSLINPILHSPTPHVETINDVMNAHDNRTVSFSMPPLLPQQSSLVPESHHRTQSYAATMPVTNQGPISDSFRARQGVASNPYYQANQNIHDRTGTSWEGKGYVGGDDFESWEPPHSPSRNMGWNNSEARASFGSNHRPDWSRQHQFSSGYRDHGRNGNRQWRGSDRR